MKLFLLVLLLAGSTTAQQPVRKEIARLRALAQRFAERGRAGDALAQLEEALGQNDLSPAFEEIRRSR